MNSKIFMWITLNISNVILNVTLINVVCDFVGIARDSGEHLVIFGKLAGTDF